MNRTPNLQQDGLSPPIRVARTVNEMLKGHLNNVLDITLTANVAATTITDVRLGSDSAIGLTPLTANAAAALATTYVSSRSKGQAVLTHANNAQVDRTFQGTILGA